ncbi:MAG: hypothetical protein H6741_26630 [Alphaproteobacteria bacterium]|nr:hypothetical protein [Alphaproteobacteria bacterium]
MYSAIYQDQREDLLAYLRARFPRTPHELLQDAVQDCFLEALEKPAAFDAARACSMSRLCGLLRCVAWRKLRGRLSRGAGRFEVGLEALPLCAQLPGQAVAADVGPRVAGLLREAAAQFGGAEPEVLHAALVQRFLSGESDTQVAQAFGLRREPLNRAKRFVLAELFA